MPPSRTDDILERWRMVAAGAQRPAVAPTGHTRSAGAPIGLLAAAGIAIVLIVALALRTSGRGPEPSQPAVAASSSAGLPSASPLRSPRPSPSSSPLPSGSLLPFGNGLPEPDLERYLWAFNHNGTATMQAESWVMLAPDAPTRAQGFAKWKVQEQLNMKVFAEGDGSMTTRVGADLAPYLAAPWSASVDQARAVLIGYLIPARAGRPAGMLAYIVNPTDTGFDFDIYELGFIPGP
jgi:hypothetical protein